MSLDLTGDIPFFVPAVDTCTNCLRPASDFPSLKNGRMNCCAKCQTEARLHTPYCSRDCQLAHRKAHKPFCGRSPATVTKSAPPAAAEDDSDLPPITFTPPPALALHTACLASLPTGHTISYLYYPRSPLSSPLPNPTPITLPPSSRALFALLLRTANRTGNQLSVNLMYSIMLEPAEEQGAEEGRLVEQLGEEYGFDFRRALEEEEEPEEDELERAIGGKEGMGVLLAWQMGEAERAR